MQTHLIPHLLRKDLRHVALPVALWIALLLIQAILIGTGYSTASLDFGKQMAYTAIAVLIPLLQGLVTLVIVPLVVQDEPLVGSTAHWLTRPIGRSTLLVEKLVFFAGLIVLPPIVINLVVFGVNGVQADDMLRAIPQFLMTGWYSVATLMLIASLTPSFGRYALWCVVIWVVVTVAACAIQFWKFWHGGAEEMVKGTTDLSLAMSRSIASSLFILTAATGLVAWQYLTRRTKQTVILAVVALAGAVGMQNFWPVNFLQAEIRPGKEALFAKGEVALKPVASSIRSHDQAQYNSTAAPQTVIIANIAVSGLPPEYQVQIKNSDAKWVLSNGENLNSVNMSFSLDDVWSARAIDSLLKGPRIANQARPDEDVTADIFTMDTAKYMAVRGLKGQYSATVVIKALKYEIAGETPLQVGGKIDRGSEHATVVSVLRQSDGYRVVMRERKVNLWFSGKHDNAQNYLETMTGKGANSVYVLVNRARGEAFIAEDTAGPNFAAMLTAFAPLVNRTTPVDFKNRDGQPVLDEAWMAGASLVKIERVNQGTYEEKIAPMELPLAVGKE